MVARKSVGEPMHDEISEEIALLRALGVPSDLISHCVVADGGRVEIQVRDDSPRPSHDQLRVGAGLGLTLDVYAETPFDLGSLLEVIPLFEGIYIGGLGEHYSNWEVLLNARSTKRLTITGTPSVALNLAELPRLEHASLYGADSATLLSVAQSLHLKSLTVEAPRLPRGFSVVAPLEWLILDGPKIVDLSFMVDASKLVGLILLGPRKSFDVGSVSSSTGLETFRVSSRELLNIEALLRLPSLARVALYDVREAPGWEKLSDLDVPSFEADANYLFDAAFRRRVESRGRRWSISPQKRQAVRTPTDDAVAHFMDGVDGTTFAPFELTEPGEGVDRYQIAFSDWDQLEDRFARARLSPSELPERFEAALEAGVAETAPAMLASGAVKFDSEADCLYVWVDTLENLHPTAHLIFKIWSDDRLLRELIQRKRTPRHG